jgi:hypothetical protein
MGTTVSPVDLDTEHQELLAVLERNLPDLPHDRRFKWIYRDNPLGPARSWFARDSVSRRVIGVASVFRRALWIGPRLTVCGQVGDFAIDSSHRTLGPALMLQRATFEPVDRGELELCYDCPPHERGMSTFRRLGMGASATMGRYVRLLRAERRLERWLGRGALAACAAPIANALLRAASVTRPRAAGLEVSVHGGRFGDEFTALDRRVGARDVVRSRRFGEDLNWRYRDDPIHEYRVLTARRAGELFGFMVLAVSEGDGFVVDLFGQLTPAEAGVLLEAAVRHLRPSGVQSLHAPVSLGSGSISALTRGQFFLRSVGPHIVAYGRPGGALLARPLAWDLTHSDVMA